MNQLKQLHCWWCGHEFGAVVYISPSVIIPCRRCGKDVQNRDINDLDLLTDEDRDYIDSIEDACI